MIAGESLTTSSPSTSTGTSVWPLTCLDGRAVVRVDVDPLDREALVAGGKRDPLDVGRERNPVDADQIQCFRLKNQSWLSVVARIRPHENA